MAKVKFDVSGSDPDKAVRNFEPPRPGVYTCRVAEINPGFSKTDGKEDRKRPRLEVVYHVADGGQYDKAPLWDYLSFSTEAQWKMDQFLQAVGIATAKRRKGEFDTDSILNKKVKVRVVSDKNQEGDYRPKVGAVMAAPQDDEDADDEVGDDEDLAEQDDSEDTDDSGEQDYEALGLSADDDGDDDAAATLTAKAEEHGLDPDSYETWVALAEAIAEAEAPPPPKKAAAKKAAPKKAAAAKKAAPKQEDEAEDDYDNMTVADLRKELKARELEATGARPALIARLRENDEEPF